MATNEDVLNDGIPPIPGLEDSTDDALRFGNAYLGVSGTEASPTNWGRYLRRIPIVRSGQTVTSDLHTAADPGQVTSIFAETGSSTGTKGARPSGSPAAGEVLITYDSNGRGTIRFNSGDAVTACAYHLVEVPQEVINFLNETSDPP